MGVGVVKSVSPKEHTARVQWLEGGAEAEEELSMYTLSEPRDKRFRLGGIVKQRTDGVTATGEVVSIDKDVRTPLRNVA